MWNKSLYSPVDDKILNLNQTMHSKCNSWWWPDKPKYIYWVFLLFQFCDTHLEVPLISMNMYHLELTPESYKLIAKCAFKFINLICNNKLNYYDTLNCTWVPCTAAFSRGALLFAMTLYIAISSIIFFELFFGFNICNFPTQRRRCYASSWLNVKQGFIWTLAYAFIICWVLGKSNKG